MVNLAVILVWLCGFFFGAAFAVAPWTRPAATLDPALLTRGCVEFGALAALAAGAVALAAARARTESQR